MIGKRVGGFLYVHESVLNVLPDDVKQVVSQARTHIDDVAISSHNVLKISETGDRVSFLEYRDFESAGFPELSRSWLVRLDSGEVLYRDFSRSINPPILHRKETLISEDDPNWEIYKTLTDSAESLGLFEKPHLIGFKQFWDNLVRTKGYEVIGNELIPLANVDSLSESVDADDDSIQRHLTALTRYGFSAPMQALARFGFLNGDHSVFDYGCGRGDDVRGLLENEIEAFGWDPYFAKDGKKEKADVVNLGFVINVIEDPKERQETLKAAYGYASKVLVVSAMIGKSGAQGARTYQDGVVTSRNTFQKYFMQDELKNYIESTLSRPATPVSPGVFFVFVDDDDAQNFAADRIRSRRRRLTHSGAERTRSYERKTVVDRVFEEHTGTTEKMWARWVDLGREPEKDELPKEALELNVRSLKSIFSALIDRKEHAATILEEARLARVEDLRVYFSKLQFTGKQKFKTLSISLRRDIKHFFGDYNTAIEEGRKLLFTISDIDVLLSAVKEASDQGLGFLDSDAFFLHSSNVERLPSVLRAYIHCGTHLYGDVSTMDVVKIHLGSGKLSLMSYDAFEDSPLPKLQQRIKLNLRTTDIDIFEYTGEYAPQYLYHKSRYVNEEYPRYAEQIQFEEQLNALGLLEFDGFGPSVEDFDAMLQSHRVKIHDFSLIPLSEAADLDDPCGENFIFRDLIECGETQASTAIENLPQNPETYTALYQLAVNVLDPVIDYFGPIKLTYGFCSQELGKKIKSRVAPKLDQHASHEKNRNGNYVCDRLGAAVDFIVEDEDMLEVAQWIHENVKFDRLYFYGPDRPIHVSYSDTPKREAYELKVTPKGNQVPRKLVFKTSSA